MVTREQEPDTQCSDPGQSNLMLNTGTWNRSEEVSAYPAPGACLQIIILEFSMNVFACEVNYKNFPLSGGCLQIYDSPASTEEDVFFELSFLVDFTK